MCCWERPGCIAKNVQLLLEKGKHLGSFIDEIVEQFMKRSETSNVCFFVPTCLRGTPNSITKFI